MNTILRLWLRVPPLFLAAALFAQTPSRAPNAESLLLTAEGKVEVFAVNGSGWTAARTNQVLRAGDRLRTGARSRATARLSDLSVLRVNELTTLQIQPPEQPGQKSQLQLNSGAAYLFSRERPAEQQFRTPLASAAIRGTEFNIAVADDGRTTLSLIDGQVALSNPLGQIALASGDQGVVEAGKAPVKTAMIEAVNIIQWSLYYPGILDTKDLELAADARQALAASLDAYSKGDLLQAVAQYPEGRDPASDAERVYRAATLLSVGQVEQAQAILAGIETNRAGTDRPARLAVALREVVAAVKNQPGPRAQGASLGTEWLAESYYFQSQGRLVQALQAARAAVERSPEFGFGWARVAEMELSFGRFSQALAALEKSLALSPRNAQSLAVKGFLLLGRNHPAGARAAFDQAIALDGALGNAWLGRGLCKIRDGDAEAGRQDLQVAALHEPQRAVLRSYLGKAFSNAGDNARARKELDLAERFDPGDPTAWLYSALVNQQENEVNRAVRDLEQSEKLNNNRRLFRSKLLLDEDQSVRGANLANIYQDTGYFNWEQDVAQSDWSVREASRAVDYDYASFSAHQFLANSYDALRDPHRINLRYETPWASELLMVYLLAPVGAGNLSEFNSQQANARLFEQNHFGLSSDTEYLSHGDWLERASQYGTWEKLTYAADVEYRSERGWRVNNDLRQLSASLKAKDQLTPQDSILLEGAYFNSKFGDEAQYYNQYGDIPDLPAPSPTFRGWERQEPNLFVGYHHEWLPGLHTLFLGGRLDDTLHYTDSQARIPFYYQGFTTNVSIQPFSVYYNRQLEAYTAELQQIWQTDRQTLVAGGRYQRGWNTTSNQVDNLGNFPPLVSQTNLDTDLERYSIYAYETVRPVEQLQLTAGLSYDHLHYPRNIDTSPITSAEADIDQVSPKAGFIWSPLLDTHVRFAYTRSLGGVFFDNSVRLEPTEVAGFNQAFRSVIPESVVGLVPGTRFTTYGIGIDQAFISNTYLSIEGEILDSEATRTFGIVTNGFLLPVANRPGDTRQALDFTEKTLVISLSQLLGEHWSAGARYQLSQADLNGRFVEIPSSAATGIDQDVNATLHQLIFHLNYYHPCGFFSQFQSVWTRQSNHGYQPDLPGDDFWQFNVYAGYRFLRRSAEIKLGLLNFTDQDYRLNPLNLYHDLPRGRTLAASLKFYF